eukprot:323278-Prymnesium_polylepis.1
MHQLLWLGRARTSLACTQASRAAAARRPSSAASAASPSQPSGLASVHNLVSRSRMMHSCCSSTERATDLQPLTPRAPRVSQAMQRAPKVGATVYAWEDDVSSFDLAEWQ